MNAILAIPFSLRLAILFVLGACAGSAINLLVMRGLVSPERFHPWDRESREEKPAAPRRKGKSQRIPSRGWADHIPIIGWFFLRREEPIWGQGFWLRPLLVELAAAVLLPWLYWWEVDQLQTIPFLREHVPPAAVDQAALHWQYLSHAILILFMIAASLFDLREFTIPDTVTVPAVLVGVLLATAVPQSLPPVPTLTQPVTLTFLQVTSPHPWAAELAGGQGLPLAIGLGIVWLWCLSLLSRTWRGRRGWRFAMRLILARITREGWTYLVVGLGAALSLLVAFVWRQGGPHWQGLLSALVGLAMGGGLIWTIRAVGFLALQREAMGFGDVTLMAAVGAFLGWQPCVMIVFIGPLFGVLPGLAQLLIRREAGVPLPYGPFLCLGALTTIVLWAPLWQWLEDLFAAGWLVPAVLALVGPLMLILLLIVQGIKRVFGWA